VTTLREIEGTLLPPGGLERLPGVARAYLAGFGTSGSLLIGLALMFILGSALVGPPAAGVVKSTGSGAANVIGGLTQTATGVLSGIGGL
jgi:hypothetical protein